MQNVQDRVIQKINREIGSDIQNFHKSVYLVQHYRQKFHDIEGKLDFANDNYSSNIKIALKKQEKAKQTIDFEIAKIDDFDEKLGKKCKESKKLLEDLSPTLDNVKQLENLVEYLRIVQDIQEINNALSSAIKGKDETKIVSLYLSLNGEMNSNNSIVGRLQNVEAHHMKTYATRTAVYWYENIKEKFSSELMAVLKQIKWPHKEQVLDTFSPSKENLNKMTTLAEYLFLIRSPFEDSDELVVITPSIVCPPISITNEVLLRQFRQRFFYHFTGSRQTNRLDKPEWYFTQILNWAKDNHLFVGKHFQPAAVRAGHVNYNVRLEFVRGLVQLAIEKMAIDIEVISRDEHLFAHLLDETLAFEHELRDSIGYPASFPSAISVITQPQYLLKWISIEERFSADKMDFMLQSPGAWEFTDPCNLEELKIPKCADHFIRLLDAIKDRYSCLTQPGHQMQFLNLQLELIDNFRRRLAQLDGCGSVDRPKILNAINYITSVLREWGENVHYLHLHAALVGPHATEIESVFDTPVDELEQWQRKLVKELASKLVDEIKAKSMAYRHDNWVSFAEQNSKEPFILSTTAGEMFQVMMTTLHNLENDLSMNLFIITLRLIAHHLDDFFIDSMVMNTKFSVGGASQFQYDMTRNLFPLFGQYVRRSDLLFKKINDACILLCMPMGNAILLRQTLKDNSENDAKFKALKELGVLNFQPEACIDILERRTDIRTF